MLMHDTELYQRVLGLEKPWRVSRVELNVTAKKVDLWLEHEPEARWACPQCGRELAGYDHSAERTWRHLDTCQFQTHLHARVPRVQCPAHGVGQVTVPWAEPHGRFTLLFERLIIDVLLACSTIAGASALLAVSWDEVQAVMQRAVRRGQARKKEQPIAHLGVDEKAFRKGHSYVTVVCDLDQSTVEHVAEDRTTESLAAYYRRLSLAQRQSIQAVGMDMWEPYVLATQEHVPMAAWKIVFDRFHVMQLMNEAVDKVRRQEHRRLDKEGDETLKGSKYLWLYAQENLPERNRADFRELQQQNLKTGRAWALKETLRDLWSYRSITWAKKFFKDWFGWARRSALAPVKKVALTLKRHLTNILTYCLHPITNGVAEGLNSKIMTIKRKACGFRNLENFKTAIYFFCGGLDLYPQ
jgi:transposase